MDQFLTHVSYHNLHVEMVPEFATDKVVAVDGLVITENSLPPRTLWKLKHVMRGKYVVF